MDINYEVHTKNKVKTIRMVYSDLTNEQIDSEWGKLRQNAKKQKELLLCLAEQTQPETVSYFKRKRYQHSCFEPRKRKGLVAL